MFKTRWNTRRVVFFVIQATVAIGLSMVWIAGCNQGESKRDASFVKSAGFVPTDFVVPMELNQKGFKLRPLTSADAELDFDAVMSTAERLRSQLGDDWPVDDFTVEENRQQLEIHEQQFVDRAAFVYTVLRPDESEVLGCVYVCPGESDNFDATITYWVRESQMNGNLPNDLRIALEKWIAESWPFRNVQYNGPAG